MTANDRGAQFALRIDPNHLHQLHLGQTLIVSAPALPGGRSSEKKSVPIQGESEPVLFQPFRVIAFLKDKMLQEKATVDPAAFSNGDSSLKKNNNFICNRVPYNIISILKLEADILLNRTSIHSSRVDACSLNTCPTSSIICMIILELSFCKSILIFFRIFSIFS